MSYFVTGAGLMTEKAIVTGTSPVVVLDKGKSTLVASVVIAEVSGGTPNVTIEVWDGTASLYRVSQRAMTARGTVTDAEPLQLANDEKLRVTTSAGTVHVFVNYFTADANNRGNVDR
jgi:hypothetical protein